MRILLLGILLPIQLLAQDYAGEYYTCGDWDGEQHYMTLHPDKTCEIYIEVSMVINNSNDLKKSPKILKDNPHLENMFITKEDTVNNKVVIKSNDHLKEPIEFPYTITGLSKKWYYTWQQKDGGVILYSELNKTSTILVPWDAGLIVETDTDTNFMLPPDVKFFQLTGFHENGTQKTFISEDYVDEKGVPSNYEKIEFYDMGNTDLTIHMLGIEDPVYHQSTYSENEKSETNYYSITLANRKILDNYQNQELYYLTDFNVKHRGYYYYDKKHHFDMGYYHLSEVADVWIGERFLLKYEGWWKMGVKHGKWKEYDHTGRLTSLKIYKNGQLKKEKNY